MRRTGFSLPCLSPCGGFSLPSAGARGRVPLAVARGSAALRHVGSSRPQTRNRTLWPLHQQDSYLLYHQLILTQHFQGGLTTRQKLLDDCSPTRGRAQRGLFFFSEALRGAAGFDMSQPCSTRGYTQGSGHLPLLVYMSQHELAGRESLPA